MAQALATQREEAYADLVGLAWTQRHHAALYGRVHAWLVVERLLSRQRGPMHDTLAWAEMAARADRFGKALCRFVWNATVLPDGPGRAERVSGQVLQA